MQVFLRMTNANAGEIILEDLINKRQNRPSGAKRVVKLCVDKILLRICCFLCQPFPVFLKQGDIGPLKGVNRLLVVANDKAGA